MRATTPESKFRGMVIPHRGTAHMRRGEPTFRGPGSAFEPSTSTSIPYFQQQPCGLESIAYLCIDLALQVLSPDGLGSTCTSMNTEVRVTNPALQPQPIIFTASCPFQQDLFWSKEHTHHHCEGRFHLLHTPYCHRRGAGHRSSCDSVKDVPGLLLTSLDFNIRHDPHLSKRTIEKDKCKRIISLFLHKQGLAGNHFLLEFQQTIRSSVKSLPRLQKYVDCVHGNSDDLNEKDPDDFGRNLLDSMGPPSKELRRGGHTLLGLFFFFCLFGLLC